MTEKLTDSERLRADALGSDSHRLLFRVAIVAERVTEHQHSVPISTVSVVQFR
ncbi:hypothetical protein SAMN04487937_3084 [Halorubrum sodomense]|uniref:Uncharacterized protein n=1 Tax=Halorubrum sodomense TaxID=35743 RepID=A0A1I6I4D1_HALSD|nr:hypothetical protein SAMN04487937_3084 [Halorubrum sodomense]